MQTWKFKLGDWSHCPELDGLSNESTEENGWIDIGHGFQLSPEIARVCMDSSGSKFAIYPGVTSFRYPRCESYWPAEILVEDMPSLLMLVRDLLKPLYGLKDR